ncbi:hypothetical protein [Cytophaga hutchinsonii]|uniref:Uncharacterized protein n=1 Tax=Cytophaga hutchinsonii (strain ATCC 33406 / DSM 1761 / CIP 103989 / NBRC 15051 / NCIMB 9469 / D465) TaxID=269798 RepID=A0A6N4SNT5_CYTH3|nr:hypothetical protein [Cytophaga hutchinsonii]ABG57932.1 hypothetical protein CHU_0645 [Cytophaga hutchinsonii ATCC 33406]SFX09354.1 hypothetical protein SAMN04487930_101486 [Cytophaga hutchinsonii ATCC 33406]
MKNINIKYLLQVLLISLSTFSNQTFGQNNLDLIGQIGRTQTDIITTMSSLNTFTTYQKSYNSFNDIILEYTTYENNDSINGDIIEKIGFKISHETKKCFVILNMKDIKFLPNLLKTFNDEKNYIKIGNLKYVDSSGLHQYTLLTNQYWVNIEILSLKK